MANTDKIGRTIVRSLDMVETLEKLFANNGAFEQAVAEIGGDIGWFGDVRENLKTLYSNIEELHMGAVSHLDTESVDKTHEASIGAPDYNPAKASSGGPGYGQMPQQIKLAGDSMWDKDGSNPDVVTMTDYEIVEDREGHVEVVVEHDGPWTVYTDTGFEKHISDMIGMDVEFSEQGMQEDGRAHLEGSVETESISVLKKLAGI